MADKVQTDLPLTSQQVAQLFNVTTTTVANWADEGKLPFFRTPGGHRRFRPAEIKALLADGEPSKAAS